MDLTETYEIQQESLLKKEEFELLETLLGARYRTIRFKETKKDGLLKEKTLFLNKDKKEIFILKKEIKELDPNIEDRYSSFLLERTEKHHVKTRLKPIKCHGHCKTCPNKNDCPKDR